MICTKIDKIITFQGTFSITGPGWFPVTQRNISISTPFEKNTRGKDTGGQIRLTSVEQLTSSKYATSQDHCHFELELTVSEDHTVCVTHYSNALFECTGKVEGSNKATVRFSPKPNIVMVLTQVPPPNLAFTFNLRRFEDFEYNIRTRVDDAFAIDIQRAIDIRLRKGKAREVYVDLRGTPLVHLTVSADHKTLMLDSNSVFEEYTFTLEGESHTTNSYSCALVKSERRGLNTENGIATLTLSPRNNARGYPKIVLKLFCVCSCFWKEGLAAVNVKNLETFSKMAREIVY